MGLAVFDSPGSPVQLLGGLPPLESHSPVGLHEWLVDGSVAFDNTLGRAVLLGLMQVEPGRGTSLLCPQEGSLWLFLSHKL